MTDLTPEGIELMQRYSAKDYKQGMCEDPEGDYLERSSVLAALAARATPAPTDNAALVEAAEAEFEKWIGKMDPKRGERSRVEWNICNALKDRVMEAIRAALSSRAAAPTPATVVEGAPERIRVAQDMEGFWTCREAVSGSQEYIRADLTTPPEATQIAQAREEARLEALEEAALTVEGLWAYRTCREVADAIRAISALAKHKETL